MTATVSLTGCHAGAEEEPTKTGNHTAMVWVVVAAEDMVPAPAEDIKPVKTSILFPISDLFFQVIVYKKPFNTQYGAFPGT